MRSECHRVVILDSAFRQIRPNNNLRELEVLRPTYPFLYVVLGGLHSHMALRRDELRFWKEIYFSRVRAVDRKELDFAKVRPPVAAPVGVRAGARVLDNSAAQPARLHLNPQQSRSVVRDKIVAVVLTEGERYGVSRLGKREDHTHLGGIALCLRIALRRPIRKTLSSLRSCWRRDFGFRDQAL